MKQVHGINNSARVQRVFHSHDIAAIVQEMEEVVSYGAGASDEWKKGLPQLKKDAMTDCSRWERFEMQLPSGTRFADMLREYDPSSFPQHVAWQQGQHSVGNGHPPPVQSNGKQLSLSFPSSFSPTPTFADW